MKILTISGSARKNGNNHRLLKQLPRWFPNHQFSHFEISRLPLFTDEEDTSDFPNTVIHWKEALKECDALIICTPEYIHNIPAALKNALEWVYASGELANKKVLPIVLTPKPPRGEKAMQSLLFSLKALDSNPVTSLNLFQEEIQKNSTSSEKNETIELLQAAFELL